MKNLLIKVLLTSCISLNAASAFAGVISFDGTAPPGGNHNYDYAGTYSDVSGFTLTGRFGDDANPTDFYSSTAVYTISPSFNASYPSANGTDFAFLAQGGAVAIPAPTATLSNGGTPFSLQSFLGSNIADYPAGTLTLTGHLNGGGTLTEVFNTLGGNQWSSFNLIGWTNLTSVDFIGSQNAVGLDNIVVNEASVPESNIALLMLSGILGFGWLRKPQTK